MLENRPGNQIQFYVFGIFSVIRNDETPIPGVAFTLHSLAGLIYNSTTVKRVIKFILAGSVFLFKYFFKGTYISFFTRKHLDFFLVQF